MVISLLPIFQWPKFGPMAPPNIKGLRKHVALSTRARDTHFGHQKQRLHSEEVKNLKKWHHHTTLLFTKNISFLWKIHIDFENEIMRGEGIGSLGRTCTHCYILNGLTTRTCYIAHGTLLSVMWQPGWERSLGENGHMYMDGWVPSLFIWNYHNIVNWFYHNIK